MKPFLTTNAARLSLLTHLKQQFNSSLRSSEDQNSVPTLDSIFKSEKGSGKLTRTYMTLLDLLAEKSLQTYEHSHSPYTGVQAQSLRNINR